MELNKTRVKSSTWKNVTQFFLMYVFSCKHLRNFGQVQTRDAMTFFFLVETEMQKVKGFRNQQLIAETIISSLTFFTCSSGL